MVAPLPDEAELLAAARRGSHAAFRLLVETSSESIRRHCYRMTGSVDDADDLVQETYLRARRSLGTYAGRGSFRSWLYSIATNRSLDLLDARQPDHLIGWIDDPPWLQPYPTPVLDLEPERVTPEARYDTRESIALAFLVVLQRLAPRERAALVLRDVLGYSPPECARIVGCSTAAVNSALQRARAKVEQHDESVQNRPSTAVEAELVSRFQKAWDAGDPDAIIDLLTVDTAFAMPGSDRVLLGPQRIVDAMRSPCPRGRFDDMSVVATDANAQPALAFYRNDKTSARLAVSSKFAIVVFEGRGDRIGRLTGFGGPDIFHQFQL